MKYEYDISYIKGTYVKTYLAKIIDEDLLYRFKRKFLYRHIEYIGGDRSYSYELGGHGVFELSIKRFVKTTDELLSCKREWFVYYRKEYYEIDYQDVLFCVFNLKAQYGLLKFDSLKAA